ncbi:helix-turn-helix domain-containing protein [Oscillibacter valericigenes]|uniref:helix-turn-helix domain-containing protein n=1 Tax=Oscillibacter valericigenes TaxID=351091 RepID=UPI0019562A08|nr:helix-turn-helix domain-containing protein [Oscillibacter valericigenes]MBM6909753.1 helix-turn-helix domain-containing protein [Oscillibacter valericigenes]
MRYSKYSGRGNFFSLPNEVFLLGLSAGELAVYSFLKRCENRKTHQCWPSIKTIGEAVGMSENTVRKYIRQLEERGLITTQSTEVITKRSGRRNGNLLFTLRPIQEVLDQYYDYQLEELELASERQRVAKLLREWESPA